jgi:hypothetical protein
MASEDEHRESSVEQPKTSLADEQVVVLVEAASEQGVGSDGENPPDDSSDSENASDSGGHVKIGVEVALAGMSYDFGQLTMMKAHVTSLESFACYFPKGFAQPPSAEPVPDPQENEAIVFEDFFIAGLCIPLHPILLDILRKFQVQLHQLTPNAIVQISKFVWAVTSCRGHPTADVFIYLCLSSNASNTATLSY